MNIPYIRAPHSEGAPSAALPSAAPNAALLIDFDNVTMGMRSDLSKELKSLLRSDIIKGKVTVQRAYADWRRYPQYIVPLSEASIDLIFAPAYGSSKKNATDIRMAIDGMELVFTRPEIGTYILLTGDSDFSSLVLKLKEYGKYVIGVGIQESSSDILVQNCDEYYSYTALTGLRKSGSGGDRTGLDPWVLVEKAVDQMKRRKDVMRSDRLKQVMLELDSSFDEKSLGFSKFSRFITEAAQKGLLRLRKLENGQYEISDGTGGSAGAESDARGSSDSSSRGGRSSRDDRPSRGPSRRTDDRKGGRSTATPAAASPTSDPAALKPSYELLVEAISDLLEDQEGDAIRDSDVKRRMLAIQGSWDEAELGFPKFSKFLMQADDHEVVDLRKGPNGNYEVAIGAKGPVEGAKAASGAPDSEEGADRAPAADSAPPEPPAPRASAPSSAPAPREKRDAQSDPAAPAGRLRPRTQSRRRGGKDEPPPLLEGQAVGSQSTSKPASSGDISGASSSETIHTGMITSGPVTSEEEEHEPATDSRGASSRSAEPSPSPSPSSSEAIDVQALRLPTDRDSVIKYLANSYKGVGKKTAETLIDELGDALFPTLQSDPERVKKILTPARAEKVLEEWAADYERRSSRISRESGGSGGGGDQETAKSSSGGRRRSGRRTRSRS
ncbi:MAG: NYN domain-containing protein [Gemmatimonadales bacterium]|nr:MAG: NYN domain-containing protein [Gemmatimonadales bacterium]